MSEDRMRFTVTFQPAGATKDRKEKIPATGRLAWVAVWPQKSE